MMNFLNANHPLDWLLPVKIEYAMVGLLLICYSVIPESPWYYARHGKKEQAMKSMKRLYNNIPNYDYEEEYGVIMRTIEHEKEQLEEVHATSLKDCFTGLNAVSLLSPPLSFTEKKLVVVTIRIKLMIYVETNAYSSYYV